MPQRAVGGLAETSTHGVCAGLSPQDLLWLLQRQNGGNADNADAAVRTDNRHDAHGSARAEGGNDAHASGRADSRSDDARET